MLTIRKYNEQDRRAFVALNTCPVNRANMNGPHSPESASALFDCMQQSENTRCRAVIWDGQYVGHLFLSYEDDGWELGYLIDKQHWGKGLASRATQQWLTELPAGISRSQLFATVDENHEASVRVLEKLGFVSHARLEDEFGPYYLYKMG